MCSAYKEKLMALAVDEAHYVKSWLVIVKIYKKRIYPL